MKRMIYAIAAFFMAAVVLVGCNFGEPQTRATVVKSTQSEVIIRVDEVSGTATLYDVMNALKEQGELDFESELGAYGQSLLSINGVANAADWSSYWASYTTDENNGTDETVIDGTTWYYSAAGISYLQVVAGESYLFKYTEYTPW